MATKIKPMLTRKVGHVNFKSFTTQDAKKGTYMVTTKFNGTEYQGVGPSERLATLDLSKTIADKTREDKIVSTVYKGE